VEEHVAPGLFDIAVANAHDVEKLPNGVEWVQVEDDLSEDYRITKLIWWMRCIRGA